MPNKIPSDTLYLVHVTNTDPTKIKGGLTPHPTCKKMNKKLQFPGVFFSLITKSNRKLHFLFPGKYVLIFSVNLLFQNNYHVNIEDHNGFITEHNTYFPWNLLQATDKLSKSTMNEVVFHDAIDFSYLCKVIQRSEEDLPKNLPKKRMYTEAPPNLSYIPFVLGGLLENKYTGTTEIQSSSMAWLRMMAKIAKLSNLSRTRLGLLEQLQKRSLTLYVLITAEMNKILYLSRIGHHQLK